MRERDRETRVMIHKFIKNRWLASFLVTAPFCVLQVLFFENHSERERERERVEILNISKISSNIPKSHIVLHIQHIHSDSSALSDKKRNF